MASHLRSIVVTCDKPGCGKHATHELYNTVNARSGRYCRSHAYFALVEARARNGEPKPAKADVPS